MTETRPPALDYCGEEHAAPADPVDLAMPMCFGVWLGEVAVALVLSIAQRSAATLVFFAIAGIFLTLWRLVLAATVTGLMRRWLRGLTALPALRYAYLVGVGGGVAGAVTTMVLSQHHPDAAFKAFALWLPIGVVSCGLAILIVLSNRR